MSSYGARGGVARCYAYWAEYKECLQTEENPDGGKCKLMREDYTECLHHKKEHAHIRAINAKMREDKSNGVVYSWEQK